MTLAYQPYLSKLYKKTVVKTMKLSATTFVIVVNIKSFSQFVQKGALVKTLFTNREIQYAKVKGREWERLGARFAAKLAFCNLYPDCDIGLIEVRSIAEQGGPPILLYKGEKMNDIHVSITHVPTYDS